jgi:hypothetical protein
MHLSKPNLYKLQGISDHSELLILNQQQRRNGSGKPVIQERERGQDMKQQNPLVGSECGFTHFLLHRVSDAVNKLVT